MDKRPKRRWLRFSVRTLLVVVTVVCVWLGWQMSLVRERANLRKLINARNGGYIDGTPAGQPTVVVPISFRLLGEPAVWAIRLPQQMTLEELERVGRAFPEANIHSLDCGGLDARLSRLKEKSDAQQP